MSNNKAVYSHQLTVTFEQDADNNLSWIVQADEAVSKTSHAGYEELVRAGAPLAALGIRALFDLLGEDMIRLVLDRQTGTCGKNVTGSRHNSICLARMILMEPSRVIPMRLLSSIR